MTWTSVRPDSPASESQPYLPLSAAVARSTTSNDTKSGYDFDDGEEESALLLAVVGGAGFGPRLGRMGEEGLVLPDMTSAKVRALVYTRVRYRVRYWTISPHQRCTVRCTSEKNFTGAFLVKLLHL